MLIITVILPSSPSQKKNLDDGRGWVEKRFTTNTRIEKQYNPEINNQAEENRVKEALTGYEGSTKLWIGKDYTNFIVKDFDNLDQPLKGLLTIYLV